MFSVFIRKRPFFFTRGVFLRFELVTENEETSGERSISGDASRPTSSLPKDSRTLDEVLRRDDSAKRIAGSKGTT